MFEVVVSKRADCQQTVGPIRELFFAGLICIKVSDLQDSCSTYTKTPSFFIAQYLQDFGCGSDLLLPSFPLRLLRIQLKIWKIKNHITVSQSFFKPGAGGNLPSSVATSLHLFLQELIVFCVMVDEICMCIYMVGMERFM